MLVLSSLTLKDSSSVTIKVKANHCLIFKNTKENKGRIIFIKEITFDLSKTDEQKRIEITYNIVLSRSQIKNNPNASLALSKILNEKPETLTANTAYLLVANHKDYKNGYMKMYFEDMLPEWKKYNWGKRVENKTLAKNLTPLMCQRDYNIAPIHLVYGYDDKDPETYFEID